MVGKTNFQFCYEKNQNKDVPIHAEEYFSKEKPPKLITTMFSCDYGAKECKNPICDLHKDSVNFNKNTGNFLDKPFADKNQ